MVGMAVVGVVSRQGPDKNPLIKRLLQSLNAKDPGMHVHVQIELGEQFSRGEKRQRIFQMAKARNIPFVCILEDDTEIVQQNWLAHLMNTITGAVGIGMVNPNETRDGLRPNNPEITGKVIERPNLFGFCLHGETLIHTLSGDRPIRDLVGRRPWVFSWKDGALRLAQARRVWQSRKDAPCIKVGYEWYARGTRHEGLMICTDDHPFMLLDESYLRAGRLQIGDRLMPFGQKVGHPGYGKPRAFVKVGLVHDAWQKRSHWAWEQLHGPRPAGTAVHHLDDDSLNDEPENLELIADGRHKSQHAKRWHATATVRARMLRGQKISKAVSSSWTPERRATVSEAKTRWWADRKEQERNHKITSVEPWGIADVYDMAVPGYHNFAANNVFVHNCILYNLEWQPFYDPRITWLDDMAMSLQCRSRGFRLATCGSALVRHTKEPFLNDAKPPWEQADRSRWGEGNSYYSKERFDAERRSEARLLVEQYGEMARMTLPPDLLDGVVTD